MLLTGVIEDIYEDGYVKFKVEEPELEYFELPSEIFNNVKVDSRYKISLTELPFVDRSRDEDEDY